MGKTSAPAPAPAPAAEAVKVRAVAESKESGGGGGGGADAPPPLRAPTPFTAQPHVNLMHAYRAPGLDAALGARQLGDGDGDGGLELAGGAAAVAGRGPSAPADDGDDARHDARNSRRLALPGDEEQSLR